MIGSSNLAELRSDIERAPPLVLLVGSGVSGDFIPTWEPLFIDLIDRAVEQGLGSKNWEERNKIKGILTNVRGKPQWSFYEKAGIVKRLLGRHYIRELRDCLYARVKAKYGGNTGTLSAAADKTLLGSVASLCQHKLVVAVITYNFDDLLDTVIHVKGRSVHTIYGREQRRFGTKGLPIYHVHGFLPCEGPLPSEEEALVVFSQEEYFQTMLEPVSWQTTTQLYFLRNYTCLLLGTSVTDLNMLRILSHARSYVRRGSGRTYVLTCEESIVGEVRDFQSQKDRDLAMQIWSALMDTVGVKMVLAGEDYKSVRVCVNKLINSLKHVEA